MADPVTVTLDFHNQTLDILMDVIDSQQKRISRQCSTLVEVCEALRTLGDRVTLLENSVEYKELPDEI